MMSTDRLVFDRVYKIIDGAFRVFRFSVREPLSKRRRAIKNGRLIDMQLPPFRNFNQIVQNNCPIVMTRAAYKACVVLPGETRGKAAVPSTGRWGIVYLSFMEQFQNHTDDPQEGTFEVNVMTCGGFQVPKTIKVLLDNDFDGEDGFVFMLPDEAWPDLLERR